VFRYAASQPTCSSRSRRLADSNRCSNHLGTACLHDSCSTTTRVTDFVTRNAGTSSRLIHGVARRNWLSGPPHSEARTGLVDAPVRGHSCPASCPYSTRRVTETPSGCLSSVDRRPHPLYRHHRRGGSRAHLPVARQGGSLPETGAAPLARTSSVATSSHVHSPARGSVQRCHRQRLRGRLSVPQVNVVERRRADVRLPLGVAGVTARAALQDVAGVAAGRAVLA